jgi:hypothetical protein
MTAPVFGLVKEPADDTLVKTRLDTREMEGGGGSPEMDLTETLFGVLFSNRTSI